MGSKTGVSYDVFIGLGCLLRRTRLSPAFLAASPLLGSLALALFDGLGRRRAFLGALYGIHGVNPLFQLLGPLDGCLEGHALFRGGLVLAHLGHLDEEGLYVNRPYRHLVVLA